jgi:hypothetical protein
MDAQIALVRGTAIRIALIGCFGEIQVLLRFIEIAHHKIGVLQPGKRVKVVASFGKVQALEGGAIQPPRNCVNDTICLMAERN